jgi:hypothetical protein
VTTELGSIFKVLSASIYFKLEANVVAIITINNTFRQDKEE